MNNYKILFISTKAITQNIFFKNFINNTNLDITLGCSDVLNLKFKKKKIKFNFESTFIGLLNPINFILELIKIRKKIYNKFDLVVINNPLASLYIRLALIFTNQKKMYFVHGYRFHSSQKNFKYFIFYYIEKILSKITDYYIIINKEDYLITHKYFNIRKSKILKLPSVGLDFLEFKKFKKYKNKNKNNKFKIGVISAYRDNKGYKDLIKIAEYLSISKFNTEIKCYGYDDPFKYKKIINEKNLKNITLNLFRKNIYKEIIKFDLLCHLSRREGLPVSVLETMYLGVPVICYDIRGNNDLIKNNFNGFLVKPYNLTIFKKKIFQILTKNSNIKTIKKNVSKTIYPKHKVEIVNKEFTNFIIQACKN